MSAYSFKLPDIGEGTAEAEIVAWHVKVGDTVVEDQVLVDMMTDKATVELSSPVGGIVRHLAAEAGMKTAVGSVLVTLETKDGGVTEPAARHVTAGASATSALPAPPPPKIAVGSDSVRTQRPGSLPAASPSLRRRAAELGIKLELITGTGPNARITTSDFEAFVAAAKIVVNSNPVSGSRLEGAEEIPLVGVRRQIADRMLASKRNIPHFTYVETVDVTALEDLRAYLNAKRTPHQAELTALSFVVMAISMAVPKFPQVNALNDDETGLLRRHRAVHVGIATSTDQGLMVPVIRHAEALDIWQLGAEVARIATAVRTGTIERSELVGSTITVSGLGVLGGVVTTPIINLPEVAILWTNRIIDNLVVRHGATMIRKMMNLSSSFDHRVVDGADAAEFIQYLKSLLEHPAQLFMPRG
jgi:2-oxoisovalerate dehydrogenase E2 component (dihydrolipoyl transacylase)